MLLLPVLERMALNPEKNGFLWTRLDANDMVQFDYTILDDNRRLLNQVLDFWDFRKKDGWQPILESCVEEDGSLEADAAGDTLQEWLRTFTSSELYSAVRDSEYVAGHDEFLLTIEDRSLPPCRGWIDVLFRDVNGEFRIVAFHTNKDAPLATAAAHRAPFLAFQAEAVRGQTGRECSAIDLFDLNTGKSERIERVDVAGGWEIVKELLNLHLRK
jgi:hypothetical protein